MGLIITREKQKHAELKTEINLLQTEINALPKNKDFLRDKYSLNIFTLGPECRQRVIVPSSAHCTSFSSAALYIQKLYKMFIESAIRHISNGHGHLLLAANIWCAI